MFFYLLGSYVIINDGLCKTPESNRQVTPSCLNFEPATSRGQQVMRRNHTLIMSMHEDQACGDHAVMQHNCMHARMPVMLSSSRLAGYELK